MARHEWLVSCAPLVAAVLAAALLAFPARSAGHAPPPEGPPGNVQELLLRRGRPDLYAVGTAECVAYVAGTARERPVLWYLFPRRGEAGAVRIVQGLGPDGLAQVAEACGPVAARYARVVDATCSEPAALLELLRSPELLSYRVPELPTHLRWARRPERGHLALADDIGCARVSPRVTAG